MFIGAMMFWTVALGLGGWSFMLVSERADGHGRRWGRRRRRRSRCPGSRRPRASADAERIPVQVEESQESEDVNDNAGAALPAALDRGALERLSRRVRDARPWPK